AIFVSGQAYEYAELVHEGVTMSSSAFSSVFYLATGFHGIHVIGGLMAFLLVLLRAFTAEKFTAHERISAICVSYSWHFVDIGWVGLFFVVYLLDPVMTALDPSHLVPVSMDWTIFCPSRSQESHGSFRPQSLPSPPAPCTNRGSNREGTRRTSPSPDGVTRDPAARARRDRRALCRAPAARGPGRGLLAG